MGLIHADGSYTRIVAIMHDVDAPHRSRVDIATYKDLATRQAVGTTPGPWDVVRRDSVEVATLPLRATDVPRKNNRREDVLTVAYSALRNEPPYSLAEDAL